MIQSEWLQELSNVDMSPEIVGDTVFSANDASAHWVPSHLDAFSTLHFANNSGAVSSQAEVATSSNACLGPMSPLNDVPAVPHVPHVAGVATLSAPCAMHKPSKINSHKRKGSVRDSPPRKFAFAGQKSKDMDS